MLLCTQCGAANSAQSGRCHSCSSNLNQQLEPATPELETSRFDEFAEQAQAYQAGEISRWEFGQWVRQTREVMSEKREDYVEVVREGEFEDVNVARVQTLDCLNRLEYHRIDYFNHREAEVSQAMEGIFQIEAAMVKMLEFARDESLGDSVLVDALQQMWEGNLRCNQAIQMNREFRDGLVQNSNSVRTS